MRRFKRHLAFRAIRARLPIVSRLLVLCLLVTTWSCDHSGSAPTSPRAHLHPVADFWDDLGDDCPPCTEPLPWQYDSLYDATLYIQEHAEDAGSDAQICAEAAQAAQAALLAGKDSIGDYDGISYWNGIHPNDQWSYTQFGSDLWSSPPPPPLYLELVVAHEFIHVSQHMHADPYESDVESMAEACVFGS